MHAKFLNKYIRSVVIKATHIMGCYGIDSFIASNFQVVLNDRKKSKFKAPFTFENTCSAGLRSGEYMGV